MSETDPSPAFMPASAPHFDGDEAERLRVLDSYQAAALEDDPELQGIVAFAARLCDVQASMVTVIGEEQQTFLARHGVEERGTALSLSFCVHALGQDAIMEVPDAASDARFAQNPLVTGGPLVRYYAGKPLLSDEGAPLGTLCVIDTKPHEEGLTPFQRQGLTVLAQAAMRRLKARRESLQAERAIAERENRLRQMIDALPQIAWAATANSSFDYFNARWQEMTGNPPPAALPDWEQFVHPDDLRRAVTEWRRCVEQGVAYETEFRLRQADGSWRWVLSLAVPVGSDEGPPRWFGTITDIDAAYRLSESRDMLARELSHRIKNIFAVVTGLISLQARKETEHQDFAARLTGVLHALGRAHEFVRPAGGSTRESLQGLLEVLFAPYVTGDGGPRIRVSGEECAISPNVATPLALVFHELATNSAKYGALSVDDGYVTLSAEDRGEHIALHWREHDGPAPETSGDAGFGSRMVDMAITGQLQGSWERRFEPGGMQAEIVLARHAIAPAIEAVDPPA